MVHLDFITIHDRLDRGAREELAETLQRIHSDHNIEYSPEELLRMEKPIQDAIPQGAVLYVHGHFGDGYRNIGLVKAFATQRPDLRFILNVDPQKSLEKNFGESQDYQYLSEINEHGFHARHQVVVSPYHPRSFFAGIDYWSTLCDPIENSLEAYVEQWKQIQEALR